SDDGDVADSIYQEAPSLAGGRDQHAGERRANEAGDIDHGRVDGDGVAQVGAIVDHLHHERLAAGHVEAVDDALRNAEGQDPGNIDVAGECECGEGERLQHGGCLRPYKDLAAVEAVNPDACEGSNDEGGNLACKAHRTEEHGRSGEAIDEPCGGDA